MEKRIPEWRKKRENQHCSSIKNRNRTFLSTYDDSFFCCCCCCYYFTVGMQSIYCLSCTLVLGLSERSDGEKEWDSDSEDMAIHTSAAYKIQNKTQRIIIIKMHTLDFRQKTLFPIFFLVSYFRFVCRELLQVFDFSTLGQIKYLHFRWRNRILNSNQNKREIDVIKSSKWIVAIFGPGASFNSSTNILTLPTYWETAYFKVYVYLWIDTLTENQQQCTRRQHEVLKTRRFSAKLIAHRAWN